MIGVVVIEIALHCNLSQLIVIRCLSINFQLGTSLNSCVCLGLVMTTLLEILNLQII